MDTYLSYFDQLRYMVGLLALLLLLCHGILPARPYYQLKLALCCGASLLASVSLVPLLAIARSISEAFAFSIIYWCVISFLPVIVVRICYDVGWAEVLFRAILCQAAENFISTIVYYSLGQLLLSRFSSVHPLLYNPLAAGIYAGMIVLAWFFLRQQVKVYEGKLYRNPRKTAWMYLCIYVIFYCLISLSKLCFEWVILPLANEPAFSGIYLFIQVFLVLVLLLLSFSITALLLGAYQNMTLQNEKQIVMRMMRDRQAQYEFSRENIEMINRKAHDIKHQLLALGQVPDEDRQKKIQEASQAIAFYDAVVKTGNDALDTILTEKNVYCLNRGIRLSCIVQSQLLMHIEVVDLYTLLGNALDNAIEAVDRLSESEKKTISLSIRDQNQMIFLQVENYYEGTVEMKDGLPVTTKPDELEHGYGTKSIRAIVRHYGGTMIVRAENQVFSLEILIPT